MDVVIRYGLYNVGDSVASDIVLTEAGFGTDDFDIAGKILKKQGTMVGTFLVSSVYTLADL